MKKRILSILLTLAMVIGMLPATSLAAGTAATKVTMLPGATEVELTAERPYLVGKGSATSGTLGMDECTAYFDVANNTLTLQGYVGAYVIANGEITVLLNGSNSIALNGTDVGIRAETGDLTIKGHGTLNIGGPSPDGVVKGISAPAGKVTLSDGVSVNVNLEFIASSHDERLYGIHANGGIEILEDASFNADLENNGNNTALYGVVGLYVDGSGKKIIVNTNGDVKIDTNDHEDFSFCPVYNPNGSNVLTKVGTMALTYYLHDNKATDALPAWTYAASNFAVRTEVDDDKRFELGSNYGKTITSTYRYGTNKSTVIIGTGYYPSGEEVVDIQEYLVGEIATIRTPATDVGLPFLKWQTDYGTPQYVNGTDANDRIIQLKIGSQPVQLHAMYQAFVGVPTFNLSSETVEVDGEKYKTGSVSFKLYDQAQTVYGRKITTENVGDASGGYLPSGDAPALIERGAPYVAGYGYAGNGTYYIAVQYDYNAPAGRNPGDTAYKWFYSEPFTIDWGPKSAYEVSVTGGKIGDSTKATCAVDSIVTVTANTAPSGQQFKEWSGVDGLTFVEGTSKNSVTVKFTMPTRDVALTAVYEDIPDNADQVIINNGKSSKRTLTATMQYLVNGEVSNTGTLGSDGCTAYFNPSNGTLYLKDFTGDNIYSNKDITVDLRGENTLTFNGGTVGLMSENGDITITSGNSGKLTIADTWYGELVGIYAPNGKVTLSGGADVSVTLEQNNVSGYTSYGIRAQNGIDIKNSASFAATVSGYENKNETANGLRVDGSGADIVINTTGDVTIDTSATDGTYYGSHAVYNASGKNILTNVGTMTLKWDDCKYDMGGSTIEADASPEWSYPEGAFKKVETEDETYHGRWTTVYTANYYIAVTDLAAPAPGTNSTQNSSITFSDNMNCKVTPAWYDANGSDDFDKFEAGETYTLYLNFSRTDSAAFPEASKLSITVNGEDAEFTLDGTLLVIEKQFTVATPLTSAAATVAIPVGGRLPSFDAAVPDGASYAAKDIENNYYYKGVSWTDADGDSVNISTPFVAGETYTLKVWLKAIGNTFTAPALVSATLNGGEAGVTKGDDASEIIISRTFVAADPNAKVTVNYGKGTYIEADLTVDTPYLIYDGNFYEAAATDALEENESCVAWYDAAANELILQGYEGFTIYSEGDLNIKLVGDNTITINGYTKGLESANGDITVTSDSYGTLTINSTWPGECAGIYAPNGSVTLAGSAVVATNMNSGNNSTYTAYGILAETGITITYSSSFTATCTASQSDEGANGLRVNGEGADIVINTFGNVTIDTSGNQGTYDGSHPVYNAGGGDNILKKVGTMTLIWWENSYQDYGAHADASPAWTLDGPFDKTETTDEIYASKKTTVYKSAEPVYEISVNPTALEFSGIPSADRQTLTITNTGNMTLTQDIGIHLTGANASAFIVDGTPVGKNLAPGESVTVEILSNSGLERGTYTAQLNLYSSELGVETNVPVKFTALANYSVVFLAEDGTTIIDKQNVMEGETVTKPEDPEDPAGVDRPFLGWYTDDGELFDFDTSITENTYLTPKFKTHEITAVEVNVTAPAAGGTPSYEVVLPEGAGYVIHDRDDFGYTNGMMWEKHEGGTTTMTAADKFEVGKSYTFTVLIKPKAGYEFYYAEGNETTKPDVTVTMNGETATFKKDGYWLIVQRTFTIKGTTLSGSTTDGIKVTVENLKDSGTLIVAQYNGGKMVAVQTMTVSADGTYTMNGLTHKSGCTYKAFLVNSTSYAPLCEAKDF
ncbi:MAG: hypothetical protein IKU58_07725 [Clostridia bacterium]|nr:hypothetical protein [Clostridia bacterium]